MRNLEGDKESCRGQYQDTEDDGFGRSCTGIAELLKKLGEHGIDFKDLQSSQSSLEEIFVNLVRSPT